MPRGPKPHQSSNVLVATHGRSAQLQVAERLVRLRHVRHVHVAPSQQVLQQLRAHPRRMRGPYGGSALPLWCTAAGGASSCFARASGGTPGNTRMGKKIQ